MKKIEDILNRKGKEFFSVSPKTSVIEALKIMEKNNIGSVLVMDNNTYCGILTERDYARKVILKGKKSSDMMVEEIMSVNLPKISLDTTTDEATQLMGDKNIRYLPVFENDNLYGVISIGDLVKEIILSQEEAIAQLRDYMQSHS